MRYVQMDTPPNREMGCGSIPQYRAICRLSAVWSAARVCRHGWFDSKGGFYTPVAQVVEQRSPKPHVAGSSPAGSACVPYEGAAQ